jgi:RHS repeat-associated protein
MQNCPLLTSRVGIRSTSDYSPFGVQLDGRTANSGDYRYGYQGSEADNEIKGQGLSYTTYFRQLDPRVGRWLSIDPDKDNWSDESPYVSMINNPVVYNDPDGDCPWCALFDYAFQVTVNLAKGDGIKDAFIGNVDFVSVGVNLIPGGKGILKVAKMAGELYTTTHETTSNKGVRGRSPGEIAGGVIMKHATKKAVSKLGKLTSDKVITKSTNAASKQAKKVEILQNKAQNPNKKGQNRTTNTLAKEQKKLDKLESKVKILNDVKDILQKDGLPSCTSPLIDWTNL